MAFDYSRLRGKIIEKYGSHSKFARALGYSDNTLSLKLNNKVRFTSDDIIKCVDLLDIKIEEIGLYFFTLRVLKNKQRRAIMDRKKLLRELIADCGRFP